MDRARTVVVSGVPVHVWPASTTADKLIIHFQTRRRSDGGDVSEVTYPTSIEGVAFVTFDHREDAEKVVKKERHVLTGRVFNEEYLLTVFPFSSDVFLYVSTAKVDLSSIEGDQALLIESLRSTHRSLRFRPLPRQKSAEIEGPFAAVRALRTDLLRRIGTLKSDSVQLAALNPKVSSATSKVKELTASGSLSGLPQRTGEASESQSLLPKRKTPNDFLTQTVSYGNFPDSFSDSSTEDRLKYTEHSLRRQVVGEESNPRFLPSLSDLNLHPAEDVKLQKDTIRRENYSPDKQSVTHSEALLEKDPTSSDSEGTRRSLSPGGRRNTWLDSYTFRYVEKFYKPELQACLSGVTASVKHSKGSDLLRVSLTAAPNSPGGSRTDEASRRLEELMSYWQSELSIYQVEFNKTEPNGETKVTRICKDVSSRFVNIFYVIEDSCVKVVGRPGMSRLFCEEVKGKVARL